MSCPSNIPAMPHRAENENSRTTSNRLRKKSTFRKNGHEMGSSCEFRSNQINVLRRCKRRQMGLEAPPTDFFRSLLSDYQRGFGLSVALVSRGTEERYRA